MKYSIALSVIFVSIIAFGQEKEKFAKFGFDLGVNRSNLDFSAQSNQGDITNGLGYRLGVLADLRISSRLSFSPKAELSFNASRLEQQGVNYKVNPTNLEFMGHLKYNVLKNKFTPYLIAGPNFRMPLGAEEESNIIPTKNDLAIDIGAGLDIPMFGWFTLAPEIRYSFGLNDIEDNSSSISNLRYNNIALVLIFKD